MSKPIFIDLDGNTARIDPQRTPTAYVRLSIMTEQAYSGQTGKIISRPQAVEVYITVDQANALADALLRARTQEPSQ
ncbi:hypothetical protein V8Z80_08265 [Orrella sp. JC864]|uniref:hypothetical protein n=1 Tax=Orrella sp. JC864 TaxID=3120298 RepID=UPI003009481B